MVFFGKSGLDNFSVVCRAIARQHDCGGPRLKAKVSPEARRAIELERRAHRIRMDILRRPGLLERLREGREAIERGEGMTLEELDRELAQTE